MNRFFLPLVVCISGAAVLALEILGTRILGPYYGMSLYLWSSLISTTLLALSLGYFLGGRMADKRATFTRLSVLLVLSGLWTAAIPWLRGPLQGLGTALDLRSSVLCAAVLLFFVPLVLLAMISPLALKLRATTLEVVGRSAGSLSALSTMAGVAAALATGFFFIPNLGVTGFTLCISIVLLVTGLAGIIGSRRSALHRSLSTIAGVLILALPVTAFRLSEHAPPPVLEKCESPYAELCVKDQDGSRFLLVDGIIHSQVEKATWESRVEYVPVMEIPAYILDRKGSALLLGLGGGSLVRSYVGRNWSVDAVEIDPDIVRLAKKYFDLHDGEAGIFVGDARQYFAGHGQRFDVILVDAFGSGLIPFHLVSSEAFQTMKGHLAPDGILAINTWALGWNDRMVLALAATLRQQFRNVLALPIAEPPITLGNLVLLASDSALVLRKEIERDYMDPDYRFGPKYQRVHAWDNQFVPASAGTEPITDDRNFVDVWAEPLNYAARMAMAESTP